MLEFVLASAAVVFGVVKGIELHRRRTARRTLEALARVRRLRFVAPASERMSPRVEGSWGRARVTIDYYRLDGELRTRVQAEDAPRTLNAQIRLRSDEGSDLPRLRCDGPDGEAASRCLLEVARPMRLLEQRPHMSVVANGVGVTVSWATLESSLAHLEAACEIASTLSSWKGADTPYR